MASIIFKQADGNEITCELVAATISFGKADDNDLVLADEAISSRHGTISFEGERFIITDLDSTNGTKINGQAISRHELDSRDRIEVGQVAGVFYADGEVPDAADFVPKVATSTVTVSAKEKEAPSLAPTRGGGKSNGVAKPAGAAAAASSGGVGSSPSPYDEESNTGFYAFVMAFLAIFVILIGLCARHYSETSGFFVKDAWEKIRYIEREGPLIDVDGNLVDEAEAPSSKE